MKTCRLRLGNGEVEDVEEEILAQAFGIQVHDKPEPLVVEVASVFRNKSWASEKTLLLFGHRDNKIVFREHVVLGNFTREIPRLLPLISESAVLVEVPGCHQNEIA